MHLLSRHACLGIAAVTMVNCTATPVPGLIHDVDPARYQQDLERVAAAERSPGSVHWLEIQRLCVTRLEELGFEVEQHHYGSGTNVIGTLSGRSDERVLLSAHYDSVPDCVGADDNASGVAGLLEAARVLVAGQPAGGYSRTLVAACWDEEERGLIGSEHYASRARAAGEAIAMALVFEMIGYSDAAQGSQRVPEGFETLFAEQHARVSAEGFRGDFIALVHDDREVSRTTATRFEQVGREVGLPVLTLPVNGLASLLAADLLRSDHASFWREELPAMMITDTSEFRNAHYHCRDGADSVASLDRDFAARVVQATVGAAYTLLGP